MNKVYIVIVNYNKWADTIECLETVLKSNYPNFQIFLVDNSDNNSSIKQFSEWICGNTNYNLVTKYENLVLPPVTKPLKHVILDELFLNNTSQIFDDTVTIIKSKNRGFAAANNVVLRYILKNGTESSLVWLLNNDTVIEKYTLSNLVAFYNKCPNKKYILGAKLRQYNSPKQIQAVSGTYNKWLGKHKHVGEYEEDCGQYDKYQPGEMDYVVGASVFLPKIFIEQAGLMCEDYFLYFEEMDWLNTGRQFSYSLALVPDAIVYHKEGASINVASGKKKDTSLAEFYSITSRVRFIKKWYPYCLPVVMSGIAYALLKRLILGKFHLVKKASITIFNIFFS